MNLTQKSAALFGLAALTLGTLAASPASAKVPIYVRHAQKRHAATLDRKAAHAAYNGNYRRASRLRHEAAHLRTAARHGR